MGLLRLVQAQAFKISHPLQLQLVILQEPPIN